MKNFCQKAQLILSLEKDDEKNIAGMQLRVWKFNNGTTVLVRILKHDDVAEKKLWDGKRTLQEVHELILTLLKDLKIISDKNNWEYSVDEAINFCDQDEYEEKENSTYFSWSVKKSLLHF